MKLVNWFAGLFSSTDGASMTRFLAFLCVLIAGYGVYVGRDALTITALVGGGAVALIVREKS